jgi:hypothetical protein
LAAHTATNVALTFNALSNGPWNGVLSFENYDGFDPRTDSSIYRGKRPSGRFLPGR